MNKRRISCIFLVLAGGLLIAGSVWAAAGDLLWEKPFNFLPQYNNIVINAMSASPTAFLVCGYARNLDNTGGQLGFIKAFDVATGNLKWEDNLTLGTNGNNFNSITSDSDLVLVKGFADSLAQNPPNPPTYTLFKVILRAYNADTGKLLWEVIKDFYSTPIMGPTDMVVANNRVFLAGYEFNPAGQPTGNCIVRAWQVKSSMPPISLLLDK